MGCVCASMMYIIFLVGFFAGFILQIQPLNIQIQTFKLQGRF